MDTTDDEEDLFALLETSSSGLLYCSSPSSLGALDFSSDSSSLSSLLASFDAALDSLASAPVLPGLEGLVG